MTNDGGGGGGDGVFLLHTQTARTEYRRIYTGSLSFSVSLCIGTRYSALDKCDDGCDDDGDGERQPQHDVAMIAI